MKKKAMIFLALVIQSAMVYSQIILSGKVTDGNTGEAIPGANVYAQDLNQGTVTDSRGEYKLNIKTVPPITMVFSFVGYQQKEQEVNSSGTLNIQMEPSIRLEEVIIRSVRADESVPITQSTLSKRQIRNVYNGEDPQFFLERLTPSITVESESGTHNNNYGKMRLRGIDQKRMNITLNGIPLNDMIDHGVYFSNFADFGKSIETIQVQRGIGTSTNGTSSYAGSINFESINLQHQEAGTEFQLGAGSFNSFRTSVEHFTGMLENKSAFYGRFSKIWSDGYKYHTGTNAYSFFLSGGFFLDKDLVKINAFTGRTKTGLGYEVTPLSLIKTDPKTNLLSENDREDFGQHFVQIQHSRSLNSNFSLVSSAYYGGAEGDFPWGMPVSGADIPDFGIADSTIFVQINYPLINHHFGLMSNLHYDNSLNLTLDAGIHAYTFKRQNIEQLVPNYANPYYHEKSKKDELATFAKINYRIDNILFYGDLQARTQVLTISPDYGYMDTVNLGSIPHSWTFLNPKVGISYRLNRNQDLYVSYGRSGREPTKTDIIGSYTLSKSRLARTMDRNLVKPEFVNDFEGGFRINYSFLKGQINLFFMDFQNELAPTGALIAFGSSIRQNVARSNRKGVETDFILDFSRIYLSGIMTYMESTITDIELAEPVEGNLQSALTPKWNMNFALGIKPTRNLDVQLNGRFLGNYYTDLMNNQDYAVPSYFIMGSRLIYNLNNKFSFNMELNNIFDRQYYNFGAPVWHNGSYEPGYHVSAGRNIYFTITSRF